MLADQGLKPAAHHLLLISKLESVARGEIKRLMVFMPPGSAKSTYVSVLFAAWMLAQRPGLQLIAASMSGLAAENFSRKVQGIAREHGKLLGYQLASEAAELWATDRGGQYRAAGVGGIINSFRADLSIIDDPVKGREEAESETIRAKTWDWYTGDFLTRLKPDAAQIVVQTRWHEADLSGRILETERDHWDVVSLPAQAGADDALGRASGEWLWSDDGYGYGALLKERKFFHERTGSMRDWESLYQQDPKPASGTLFKTPMVQVWDTAPAGHAICRAWDLASTAEAGTARGDFTAGVKLLRTLDGRYCVLDVVRFRGGPDEVVKTIVNVARQDGVAVRVGLPQDPGQAGKAQVLWLTRALAGFRVESSVETGDKATRAGPVASQANVGNLGIVKAAWNSAFLDELGGFPAGTYDDQVDALSRAFSMVGLAPGMMQITDAMLSQI